MENIGINIPVDADIIEFYKNIKLNPKPYIFQMFIADPAGYTILYDNKEIKEIKNLINSKDLFVIAHGRYLDIPWKGRPQTLGFINKELQYCVKFGIEGFVLHIQNASIETIVTNMKKLNIPKSVQIFLENSAHYSTYNDPAALKKLYTTLKRHKIRIGLCIDTAHLYSSGTSLKTKKSVEEFFKPLSTIPKDDIIIHLNDSAAKFNSKKDIHEVPGMGNIWSHDQSGLKKILSYEYDCILEIKDYKKAYNLLKNNSNICS